jgi:hypothetical protein
LVLSRTDEALHLSAQTAEKLRLFTEQPVVSLGRKDGTVAEFAVPNNNMPDQQIGIKIYLQNGGQSPALTPNVEIVQKQIVQLGQPPSNWINIPEQHFIHHLFRSRNASGGTLSYYTGSMAPQSERVYFFPNELTRQQYDLTQPPGTRTLISGYCEYCDLSGQYICRHFELVYRGSPFNAFAEVTEADCAIEYRYPSPPPGQQFLLPCEQPEERQAREQIERGELRRGAQNLPLSGTQH